MNSTEFGNIIVNRLQDEMPEYKITVKKIVKGNDRTMNGIMFCLSEGVDIRMAQIMMGHSDISLTANIYTNLNSIEAARNVASIMGCTGEERADTQNSQN